VYSALLIAGLFYLQVSSRVPLDLFSILVFLCTWVFVLLCFLPTRKPLYHYIQMSLCLFVIALTVLHGLDWQIRQRLRTSPASYVHDHTLQMEGAVQALVSGRNPYDISYRGTPMETWWKGNPALNHVIALPFTFLKSVPVYVAWQGLFGWYDDRLSHLPFFLLLLVALYFLPKSPELRITGLLVFVFNPLFFPFFIDGRSDIIFVSLLFASLAAARYEFWTLSLCCTALAVCSKHTAWFFVPFFAMYLASLPNLPKHFRRRLVWPALIIGGLILPFLLWNPAAFIDDIWAFPAGTTASSFPIAGFSLQKVFVDMGLLQHVGVYFPSWVLQLILLPWLIVLLMQVRRRPTVANVLLGYAFFLWPFLFFSRFFHDNYMGVIIGVLAVGVLLHYEDHLNLTVAKKATRQKIARQ
jgi:hypothetical protein